MRAPRFLIFGHISLFPYRGGQAGRRAGRQAGSQTQKHISETAGVTRNHENHSPSSADSYTREVH